MLRDFPISSSLLKPLFFRVHITPPTALFTPSTAYTSRGRDFPLSATWLRDPSPTRCRLPFLSRCDRIAADTHAHLTRVQVLRVFYSLGLLFSVPIQFFPAFEILELSLETYQRRKLTSRTIVSLRLFVCAFCTFVAILCRNYFGYFTSIIGSIGCSALLFIFPAFFHLNAFKYALTPTLYARNYALIALGIILGCASFALSVINIVNGESG